MNRSSTFISYVEILWLFHLFRGFVLDWRLHLCTRKPEKKLPDRKHDSILSAAIPPNSNVGVAFFCINVPLQCGQLHYLCLFVFCFVVWLLVLSIFYVCLCVCLFVKCFLAGWISYGKFVGCGQLHWFFLYLFVGLFLFSFIVFYLWF